MPSVAQTNPLRSTDPAFFASPAARAIGVNILLYQRVTGGWPKNIDMTQALDDDAMKQIIADRDRTDDSTTDNGATTLQIAYLARLFESTRDLRFAAGFQKGIEYLLSGQYDNGGWPQFWPEAKGYRQHITYNDDAMISTMRILRDVAESAKPYSSAYLCSDQLRERCAEAVKKGIDCILATQISVDGHPTVWCQQHDRATLKPAGARSFELPSFCSQESATIVAFLMEQPDPDKRIIDAVNGAMRWFERNRIHNKRLVRDPGPKSGWNTRLENDSTAGALWARYYDLDSCKAFVCDRDGVMRRDLSAIGVERRNGYSWYNNWPAYLYPVYDRWADRHCPDFKVPLDYNGIATAFPGAEGYGRFASGGRGGKVFHVTTLSDGPHAGTLRHAIEADGPRTIVFDIAGTIMLDKPLHINNGNLTIAGQSSPGDGICIAGQPVNITADNVIIRYLRFRVGNRCEGEPDGLQCSESRNVIIDHCTVSWSVDECCSVYGNEDTTVQWCLISESLRNAGHSKGNHGYGAIWGGDRASFHHNLLAHHDSRTPRLGPHVRTQTRELVDMRCNVIYNWGGNGCYGAEGMRVNMINNYYKPGPATTAQGPARRRILAPGVRTSDYCTRADGSFNRWKPMEHIWGAYHIDGNIIEGDSAVSADNWTIGVYSQIREDRCDGTFTDSVRYAIRLKEPVGGCNVTTHSAYEAFDLVVAHAGCSKVRDAIDRRIIEEVKTGTAARTGSVSKDAAKHPGLIDLPEDSSADACNPWPLLSSDGDGYADSDGDGMPDDYEIATGLNPADPGDGKRVAKGNAHYTNLEVYLNSLVPQT